MERGSTIKDASPFSFDLEELNMLLTYKECIKRYGTDYRIKKEIEAGRLFQKEKGICRMRFNMLFMG